MVGVQAFKLDRRGGPVELVGVHAVVAQGTRNGTVAQAGDFTRGGVNPLGFDLAVGAQHVYRRANSQQALAGFTLAGHEDGAQGDGVVTAERHVACVAALFAVWFHADFL